MPPQIKVEHQNFMEQDRLSQNSVQNMLQQQSNSLLLPSPMHVPQSHLEVKRELKNEMVDRYSSATEDEPVRVTRSQRKLPQTKTERVIGDTQSSQENQE